MDHKGLLILDEIANIDTSVWFRLHSEVPMSINHCHY